MALETEFQERFAEETARYLREVEAQLRRASSIRSEMPPAWLQWAMLVAPETRRLER
jgi:hypothetical protein